jgi:hypothetical protein
MQQSIGQQYGNQFTNNGNYQQQGGYPNYGGYGGNF